jgi:hypothetical protein
MGNMRHRWLYTNCRQIKLLRWNWRISHRSTPRQSAAGIVEVGNIRSDRESERPQGGKKKQHGGQKKDAYSVNHFGPADPGIRLKKSLGRTNILVHKLLAPTGCRGFRQKDR